jgi:hypothetical protein
MLARRCAVDNTLAPMKLANTLYALIIFLFTACSAQASPMWSYAWSDIACTAESGTHVEASVDKKGNLTKLAIVKNGKNFLRQIHC